MTTFACNPDESAGLAEQFSVKVPSGKRTFRLMVDSGAYNEPKPLRNPQAGAGGSREVRRPLAAVHLDSGVSGRPSPHHSRP